MPLLLAVVALVVVLTAGALEVGARRQSLRAPEGAANRVPDVYELAYLAGGPERHSVTVIEALARGRIISVDGKGRVAERLRHTSAMAELAARLRRWHLLLPAGYRPPVWPRVAMLAGAGCGVTALAWSVTAGTPSGSVAGAVVGGVAAAAGAGGWRLSGRHPRVPVTDAGRDVLTGIYTHYRRGGISDMAGHGVALRGADAVGDPELREQLGALEAAGTRGWAWRPAERPDETIAETTPPIPSSRFPTGYSGLRRICLCAVPALSSVS